MGAGVPGVKRGEESIWCIICCSIYTAKLRKEGVLGFEVYISAHRCALACGAEGGSSWKLSVP